MHLHAVLCTACTRHDQVHLRHCSLPADVAADDDVAAEDGALGHVLVDGVGDLSGTYPCARSLSGRCGGGGWARGRELTSDFVKYVKKYNEAGSHKLQ